MSSQLPRAGESEQPRANSLYKLVINESLGGRSSNGTTSCYRWPRCTAKPDFELGFCVERAKGIEPS
jgi:hypothetical protein